MFIRKYIYCSAYYNNEFYLYYVKGKGVP